MAKYINEDLLSLYSMPSTMAKALNICVLDHDLCEFSFTRERPRAVMNKNKCQITRMEGKEKSLGFKPREACVQIPAPVTSNITLGNGLNLSLSQVHLQNGLKILTSWDFCEDCYQVRNVPGMERCREQQQQHMFRMYTVQVGK